MKKEQKKIGKKLRTNENVTTRTTYETIRRFLEPGNTRKIYVLDTNVLMADPNAMFRFEDNIVAIPDVVIEELDNHKKDAGDIGFNVREAHRNFKKLRESGNLITGISTYSDGMVIVLPSDEETSCCMPPAWNPNKPDNIILALAKSLQNSFDKIKVAVVSNDTNVQIKADEIGLLAEEYLHERVAEDFLTYTGRVELLITGEQFELFKKSELSNDTVKEIQALNNVELKENEFVMLKNKDTYGTLVGKMKNGCIVPLIFESSEPFGITPRNSGQRFALEALMTSADEIPLVILAGPAGTAKTFLSLACGLEKTIEAKDYRRIILTRANVEFDKDIGSLPGSEEEKVGPLMRGAMDNLELLVDESSVKKRGKNTATEDEISDKVTELFDRGYIRTEALGFLRGRSLTRQYVLIDEAQNTSVSQMKGILTRPGDGTKIVICGDLDQIDNPKLDRHNNGLAYALKLMSGDPLCAVVGFSEKESTRSKLAAKVAEKIRTE